MIHESQKLSIEAGNLLDARVATRLTSAVPTFARFCLAKGLAIQPNQPNNQRDPAKFDQRPAPMQIVACLNKTPCSRLLLAFEAENTVISGYRRRGQAGSWVQRGRGTRTRPVARATLIRHYDQRRWATIYDYGHTECVYSYREW